MIRNLKVLLAAAMALAALGALSSTAQAAEEKFHCSVDPCTLTLAPDETTGTTTAHHVFVVKGETHAGVKGASISFTCHQLTGQATVTGEPGTPGTSRVATFTNLKYENSPVDTGGGVIHPVEDKCKVGASETVTVDFTSCDYKFTSTGGSNDTAEVQVQCANLGDGIDINIKGTTCLQITPFAAAGLGYHDSGLGVKHIITATANVPVPAAAVDIKNTGNANCAAVGLRVIEGATYTTGNTLVKAETHIGVTASAWFE
jgi:hypothetical protein